MNWTSKDKTRLIQAILALETESEARRFLRDLMTENEIEEFAKRLKAAAMLAEGASYVAIEKDTGLSSTTIARVAKWLNGKAGGYRAVINKLHHHSTIPLRRGLS
ncbi:MAG: YerC/YecD family TrpR-related protein [Patescibacteria group bacterium]